MTGAYFDIYETQGFHPDPSATRRDATTLYLTFDAPKGDTFVLSYDAYVQPSSHGGADATVGVVDEGVTMASVHARAGDSLHRGHRVRRPRGRRQAVVLHP